MHDPSTYRLHLVSSPDRGIAERVLARVWRFDFTAPGFCLLDLGPGVNSHTLRAWIVQLKHRINEVRVARAALPFVFRSMARFDQQQTTKFHLDGAPAQSMLILGYEPSTIVSRLFLADYTRAACDLGITPQQFLQDYNPMCRHGEELLARYVTELPQPADGHARIVLINNSSLPFSETRATPLGVMHKAMIVTPNDAQRRIVNSTMLAVGDGEEVAEEHIATFVTTENISQKLY